MENNKQVQQVKSGNNGLMKYQTLEALQKQLSVMVLNSQLDVLRCDMPSLVRIKKHFGDRQAKAVMVDVVTDFTESLNLGKNISVPQITMLINQIQQTFYYLSIADLKLFFQKMKMGAYGKFYDRMDENVILAALAEYDQERIEYVRMKDAESGRSFQNDNVSILEVLTPIRRELERKKREQLKDREGRAIAQSDLLHQRALKQFDNLYRKFGKRVLGIRFLVIGDKKLMLEDFMKEKFKNLER